MDPHADETVTRPRRGGRRRTCARTWRSRSAPRRPVVSFDARRAVAATRRDCVAAHGVEVALWSPTPSRRPRRDAIDAATPARWPLDPSAVAGRHRRATAETRARGGPLTRLPARRPRTRNEAEKEAADEALYGPRYSEIMDGNRRIAKDRELDRLRGGLAHETGGQPVECVPCSPRQVPDLVAQKAQSWKPAPESTEEKRLKFRKTFNERLRERSIICKTCGQTYTEAHNSAFACGYHPGSIESRVPRRVRQPRTSVKSRRRAWATGGSAGRAAIPFSKVKLWAVLQDVNTGTICLLSEEPRYGNIASKMLEDVVQTEKQAG